jgi:uncharacterized protein
MNHLLTILVHPKAYAICRLEPGTPVPKWTAGADFLSITRTRREVSIVCEERAAPADAQAERNWRLLQIEGTLKFTQTGVLASIATPLAEEEISIFVISTYGTDYFLVRDADLERASEVLRKAGHTVRKAK